MRIVDLIPRRFGAVDPLTLAFTYEYDPPGNCHEPITAAIAAIGASAGLGASAAEAATAATLLAAPATAAGTALATTALPAAAVAAAPAVWGSTGAALAGAGLAATDFIPSLGAVGAVAGLGGTALTAKGQADSAAYQSAVARSEAAALAQKANEDAAAGERAQITQLRRTGLVQSRAQALGAASGTAATSPDILTTQGQIAGQGEYNALSALYEGQARSRSDTVQGGIDLFKANQYERAAPLAIGGTVLSGLSSFIDKRARLKYYTASGDNPLSFGLG